jgi:hypothetical protein
MGWDCQNPISLEDFYRIGAKVMTLADGRKRIRRVCSCPNGRHSKSNITRTRPARLKLHIGVIDDPDIFVTGGCLAGKFLSHLVEQSGSAANRRNR